MTDNKKHNEDLPNKSKKEDSKNTENNPKEETKELTVEEKLTETEEKLLRSLAEIENQRRRFEKEIKMHLNLDRIILLRKVLQYLIIFKERKQRLKMMKN